MLSLYYKLLEVEETWSVSTEIQDHSRVLEKKNRLEPGVEGKLSIRKNVREYTWKDLRLVNNPECVYWVQGVGIILRVGLSVN